MTAQNGVVAVFWDYENCKNSTITGAQLVEQLRCVSEVYGKVKSFKAYADLSLEYANTKSVNLLSELQSSGVSLIHCPHNGAKDVADKMIIVDMLAFAIDNPAPATVVLITGDRDFAYAVSTLKLRGYIVIVVAPHVHAHASLKAQASVLLDWQEDILGIKVSNILRGKKYGTQVKNEPGSYRVESNDLVFGNIAAGCVTSSVKTSTKNESLSSAKPYSKAMQTPAGRVATKSACESEELGMNGRLEQITQLQLKILKVLSVTSNDTPRVSEVLGSGVADVIECKVDNGTPPLEEPGHMVHDKEVASGEEKSARSYLEMRCGTAQGSLVPDHRQKVMLDNNDPLGTLPVSHLDTGNISSSEASIVTSTTVLDMCDSTPCHTSTTSASDSTCSISHPDPFPDTLLDPRFTLLVSVLRAQRKDPSTARMRSSKLARKLKQLDPDIYENAGAIRLKDYLKEACEAHVLMYGELDETGDSWVEMWPSLYETPGFLPDTPILRPISVLLGPRGKFEWILLSMLEQILKHEFAEVYYNIQDKGLMWHIKQAVRTGSVIHNDAHLPGKSWIQLMYDSKTWCEDDWN